MKRWLPWIGLLAVVVVAVVIGTRGSGSPSAASRITHIEAEVRCPQCEGQSALASDAPAARAVRDFVTQQVQAGQSNGQIEQALVDKFGSDILLRPPSSGIAGLVWVLPIVALAIAGAGLFLAFRRWRSMAAAAPVTDDDRARVAKALGEDR